jgi:hypothetical protein
MRPGVNPPGIETTLPSTFHVSRATVSGAPNAPSRTVSFVSAAIGSAIG